MSIGAIISSFFIPVICGYVLLNIIPRFRLKVLAHDENGYRLIMRSLLCGLVYLYLVILFIDVCNFISNNCITDSGCPATLPNIEEIYPTATISKIFNPEPLKPVYIFWSLFALFAAYLIQRKKRPEEVKEEETSLEDDYLIKNGDHFIFKVIKSQEKGQFVILTLKSRKVYLGYISERPRVLSNVGRKSLVIWPVESGYRHHETLEVIPTNHYWLFFEVQKRKKEIENFFRKTPKKLYDLQVDFDDGTTEHVALDRVEFEHLIHNFGVTLEWEEIDSIISYIGSVDITS